MVSHSEEERLLQKLRETEFLLHEVVLFLDTHPRDGKAFSAYNSYRNEYEAVKAEYEKSYGPLSAFHVRNQKYDWTSRPWPWQVCASGEKGGN